jgi:hypothetical protein
MRRSRHLEVSRGFLFFYSYVDFGGLGVEAEEGESGCHDDDDDDADEGYLLRKE